jgi:hypothetical protein
MWADPTQAKLMVQTQRATAFDASSLATWADIVVKNQLDDNNIATGIAFVPDGQNYDNGASGICAVATANDSESHLVFISRGNGAASSEKMRLTSAGSLLVGKTAADDTVQGTNISNRINQTTDGDSPLLLNRGTDDGTLVILRQNNVTEGSISVSGGTVSYNGGHLSRWSQLTNNTRDNTIVKGTVMTNLDEMAEWTTDGVTEDNEQLNCMAVSSVEGDANVAGVFVNWDNDDDVDMT